MTITASRPTPASPPVVEPGGSAGSVRRSGSVASPPLWTEPSDGEGVLGTGLPLTNTVAAWPRSACALGVGSKRIQP